MAILLLITLVALIHLWRVSSERAQSIRQELFQRDLRDLVGRFDGDERYVLEHNLAPLLTERRELGPLLLPRQFYVGLPTGTRAFLPRQPPRNCFVKLTRTQAELPGVDRICAYFAENRSFGRYLNLDAVFEDSDFVTLRPGDIALNADSVKLTLRVGSRDVTWWLAFQPSPFSARKDRFDITAFRELEVGQRDRDRRVEGWAYLQSQAGGKRTIHVIGRIDFKEFLSGGAPDEDADWPPAGWQKIRLIVGRRDASSQAEKTRDWTYAQDGLSELSLSSLGQQIFSAYGSISVEQALGGSFKRWQVAPPASLESKLATGRLGFKVSDGDLLLPATATSQSEAVPDTNLSIWVSHPWKLIERGFWQIAIYLFVLLFGGGLATWYFRKNLLVPLADWSRHSEQLTHIRTDATVELPHAERFNEVGIVATAINALIASVREQTAKAVVDRATRDAETRRREEIAMRNKEQNLKVMGHEIRSPLQALVALHPDAESPTRRYIDRMMAALPHLLGGTATSDAIAARTFTMEELDLAVFLQEVSRNAESLGIERVIYSGPEQGVFALVDDGAIEDALSNLLHNAQRHRDPGSVIRLVLKGVDGLAQIEVWNDGEQIPEELQEKIFDLGFSTVATSSSGGQGVGLCVARTYLERMGGNLSVKKHERGVVFVMTLPVVQMLVT